LRYLFSNLIDEEIKRDETFRSTLLQEKEESHPGRPTNIQIPSMNINGWQEASSGPTSVATIKASNGAHMPHTPGLAIGLATPMGHPQSAGRNSQQNPYLTPTTEEGAQLEKTQTQRSSTHEPDYFGQVTSATNGNANANGNGNGKPTAATEASSESKEETVSSPVEPDTPAKKGKGMFGKKFNMSFGMKKFSTGTAAAEPTKPAAVDEKSEDSDSHSNKTDEKAIEDNFYGSIQRIRQGYEEQLAAGATKLESQIAPSLPSDTPVLKPPASTTILIQEDQPEAGGVADLFEGKVGSLGQQADLIEKAAPMWLAEVLLRVRLEVLITPWTLC
jgi:WD repeat-containing protein 48